MTHEETNWQHQEMTALRLLLIILFWHFLFWAVGQIWCINNYGHACQTYLEYWVDTLKMVWQLVKNIF